MSPSPIYCEKRTEIKSLYTLIQNDISPIIGDGQNFVTCEQSCTDFWTLPSVFLRSIVLIGQNWFTSPKFELSINAKENKLAVNFNFVKFCQFLLY